MYHFVNIKHAECYTPLVVEDWEFCRQRTTTAANEIEKGILLVWMQYEASDVAAKSSPNTKCSRVV